MSKSLDAIIGFGIVGGAFILYQGGAVGFETTVVVMLLGIGWMLETIASGRNF